MNRFNLINSKLFIASFGPLTIRGGTMNPSPVPILSPLAAIAEATTSSCWGNHSEETIPENKDPVLILKSIFEPN